MRKVLVLAPAEDQSERAVALASELAARADLDVMLVRVLEERLAPPVGEAGNPDTERLRSLLVEAEIRNLERMAPELRRQARGVSTRVDWGVPWEVVLELVLRHGIDLVVKPARGLSREGGVFFGATALHLFRKCPCPVWVVGDVGRLPTRILAAIDPGDGTVRRALASRILESSQWLAGLLGAELHVASWWHAPAAELLKNELSPNEIDLLVEDAQVRARKGLQRVVDSSSPQIPPHRVHLFEGDVRELLPRRIEEGAFDLVVMGTLGRARFAGEIMGETAELVVRAVRSSVLTVSPRSRTLA